MGKERLAFRRATVLAGVLQCLLVLLGWQLPGLAAYNLYPIAATLLAVLAGWLFAVWVPGRVLLPALVGGALAGGLSTLPGGLLAVVTRQTGVISVLVATVTGCVAGSAGGFFGRLFSPLPERR